MLKEKNYSLTYPKIAALGFAGIVIIGSVLLMLPISSKTGNVHYIDALFTATSATCITGLVTFDTFTNWTVFGQIVIIVLIQIGGLGFITLLSLAVRMTKQKMSLKQKMLLKESVGSLNLGDVKRLFSSVIIFTFSCELAGAVLLSTRFIPLAGLRRGVYMSLFTSISAFCNAGFDLMGMFSPSSSLTTVNGDPVILITTSLLIVFGGLGFIVWQDMKSVKFKYKKFSPYTKLILITTAILLIGGSVLFLFFEYNNTFADMSLGKKLLNAWFCSVTPRTAGFNSVDIAAMTPQSKMITIILMFIGGSSGSTAGGVKTGTIAVLFLCVLSDLKNKDEIELFDHRVTLSTVKKAISIVCTNLALLFAGVIIITLNQPVFDLINVVYECASALGTVGITTGITPQLSTLSKIIIISLMYIGRLTSLIFALSFVKNRAKTTTQKPRCNIMVG